MIENVSERRIRPQKNLWKSLESKTLSTNNAYANNGKKFSTKNGHGFFF